MGSGRSVWRLVEGLKRRRAVHPDLGVSPFRVVPALYPFEYRGGKFVACFPDFRVEKFELESAPERFHHGIVVAVADGAHGCEDSSGAEALPEGP